MIEVGFSVKNLTLEWRFNEIQQRLNFSGGWPHKSTSQAEQRDVIRYESKSYA